MQLSNENEKKVPPNPSCGYCDFGLVMAVHKTNGGSFYPFLCSCNLGSRRLEKYSVWTSYHKITFEILEPATQNWTKNGPVPT